MCLKAEQLDQRIGPPHTGQTDHVKLCIEGLLFDPHLAGPPSASTRDGHRGSTAHVLSEDVRRDATIPSCVSYGMDGLNTRGARPSRDGPLLRATRPTCPSRYRSPSSGPSFAGARSARSRVPLCWEHSARVTPNNGRRERKVRTLLPYLCAPRGRATVRSQILLLLANPAPT